MVRPNDVRRLERSLRHAYEHELPRRDVVALLRALLRHSAPDAPDYPRFRIELAENLLRPGADGRSAWEAARLVRDALANVALTPVLRARAHGAQGLAHTLLGNYRAARLAYEKALRLDAEDVVVCHNLGHLLDSVFNKPRLALPLLTFAQQELPRDPEIAASLAHALFRLGQTERAAATLRAGGTPEAEVQTWFARWAAPQPPHVGNALATSPARR